MKKKANKWIQSAVKHEGSLTAASKRHGVSVLSEAKKEAHSPNKKIAARGRLALRFKGKAKHGNIKKHHTKKRVAGKA
jgi:hypothetical protein